jgi:hypothetical protein
MTKLYTFLLLGFTTITLNAQEVLTFSGYDGAGSTITATTSTVNDEITIVFEDVNIIDNFYTQFQNAIYMFGGFNTDDGTFQGSPVFGDIGVQPLLTLTDGDNNVAPNTYSITINLAQYYITVPDGTMVYGFNLLFQNQFGGGGNNQTVDLYIDLVDALKDSTLSLNTFSNDVSLKYIGNELVLNNYQGSLNILVFDVTGRQIQHLKANSQNSTFRTTLGIQKQQLYFVQVEGDNFKKTLKLISN